MDEIIQFINTCGYPIAISIMLVIYNNKQILALTENIKSLCTKIDLIIDRMDRDKDDK